MKKGERTKKAPLPFTTSTLQQEASKVLNFSTQKTMRLAQQLYEGVDIKGSGTIGIITYLRTDSTRISEEADAAAREYIVSEYGEEYVATVEKKGDSEKEDSGRPRGHSPYRYPKTAPVCKGISVQRSVQTVSAYLETVCCQQNATGKI